MRITHDERPRRRPRSQSVALELLMPEHFIRDEVAKLRKFDISDEGAMEELARKFHVSPALMGMRLMQLTLRK